MKFEIGSYHVDVKRCQITGFGDVTNIEPKVMEVLVYLYSHKGEVVSQEEIFNAVWPKAIFNPSSVQRCIAILRKAFDDDAKQQSLLITHPKRGYSLEVPNPKSNTFKFVLVGGTACLIIAAMFISLFLNHFSHKNDFSNLLPISSSSGNEFAFMASPNDVYIAFIRAEENTKHIWIKQLDTGMEKRISHQPADYLSLGWSPNGNGLVFAVREQAGTSLQFATLDLVSMAPLEQEEAYRTTDYLISSHRLDWSNDNTVYFTEKHRESSDTQLVSYNLITKKKHVLHQSKQTDWLLMQSLSPDHTHIALGFEAGQNKYRVDLLNLDSGQLKTLVTIEDGLSGLSWHPDKQSILMSKRNEILSVDLQGRVSKLPFKNYQIVRDASYSYSGEEIFMELVKVDVDILSAERENIKSLKPLVNSSSVDFLPVFSPDPSVFAFESHRFGQKQLFIYEQGQERLLFKNSDNVELFGIAWSKDGKSVFTASKDTIFHIDVASNKMEAIPHKHSSFYLREAYHHSDALLVSYRSSDGVGFHVAKFDIKTGELQEFEAKGERLSCYSMGLDESDNIYFSNASEVFKRSDTGEIERVWQSQTSGIIGVTTESNMLFVTLEQDNHYKLVERDLLSGETDITWIGNKDGKMLINAAHDYSQFLYLTEPTRQKQLARLR
ncbi:winged helix-turn-helix domain-containing protein [Pseudoalteromonas luteoviolacea]|uniref:winged helix-turn-helix domain-containing protein n=1 Tax=Pseudoalteromonas luteoviolacea TaxID=43657 RepID=UPI001EEE9292|nr:winged helix-turn-helix domain-containing protein [Pseudoalteromonas luteoviolacea]MCF6439324.1 winged helix-turn-helix domain-containing protein [Pseudoalteromonas luteoviolacea]